MMYAVITFYGLVGRDMFLDFDERLFFTLLQRPHPSYNLSRVIFCLPRASLKERPRGRKDFLSLSHEQFFFVRIRTEARHRVCAGPDRVLHRI